MSANYIIRPVAWIIKPVGVPIFSETATRVEIVDEAGGEFVQITDGQQQKIQIDPPDWPDIKIAIEKAIKWCNKQEGEK